MKRFLVIFWVLFTFVSCRPVQVYVSPSGDDAARGGRKTPLRTVSAAVSRATEYASEYSGRDIEIIFMDGVYPVTETVEIDGSAFSAPLTLRAEDGAHPVFSAEKVLGGWEKLSDPRALAKLDCADKVLQADLKKTGITDTGNPIGDSNRFDLYYNGKRQVLAMWPNDRYCHAGRALGSTPCPAYFYPCFDEPVLEYVDGHIDSWADEDAPCMHGYWNYDWYDMYNPVEIDKAARNFTVGGDHSGYGYCSYCRFRGVNLLCEIDMPGEYWVDRKQGLVFWYAPEGFSGEGTTVSDFAGEYILVLENCSNVSIIGIEMCGSRGGALSVKGGDNLLVRDCTFRRFAKDVVNVDGGFGHKLRHCTLSELGSAGINMKGGDRVTLEESGFEITDCTIESLSLYRKTYQPCVRFRGCGMSIAHNLFRDGPSSAISLDGNEILIGHNRFEDLVLESDDQGAIDIWNDYNFRGIDIRHNYFHNVGTPKDRSVGGVRFDDRISGLLVESNVFDHCGSQRFGGVQIHGGHDNMVRGNVFYDCTYALSQTPWKVERFFENSKEDCAVLGLTPEMDSLTPRGKLYLERYPDLVHVFDSSLVNRNYFIGNLVVRTPELFFDEMNIVDEGTVFMPDDDGHGLDYWVSDEVLARYGMSPVEFGKAGPRVM